MSPLGFGKLHRLRSPNCRSPTNLCVVVRETRDGEIANEMAQWFKFKGTKSYIFLGLNVVDWKFGKEALRRLDGVRHTDLIVSVAESYQFQSIVYPL